MTAILDNLKRIYWEVSNASLCFELTIEEIIKFTDIQEIILNTFFSYVIGHNIPST